MDNFTLIGIGEILWDEFVDSRELGGAPANFALHASQLGGNGVIISAVGNDLPGKEIKTVLKNRGVKSLFSTDPDHQTGSVSVTIDALDEVHYTIHENVAWDFIDCTTTFYEYAKKADAVCFGTLAQRNAVSAKSIQAFLRATKKDCIRILDINLRQQYYSKTIISDLLILADVLKLNQDELHIIIPMFSIAGQNETDCLREIVSKFDLQLIVLTKGKNGSRLFSHQAQDSTYIPKPIQLADSVGAGDSFTATVALGLLQGFDLEKINENANRIAAYVCSKKGATPVIPGEIVHSLN